MWSQLRQTLSQNILDPHHDANDHPLSIRHVMERNQEKITSTVWPQSKWYACWDIFPSFIYEKNKLYSSKIYSLPCGTNRIFLYSFLGKPIAYGFNCDTFYANGIFTNHWAHIMLKHEARSEKRKKGEKKHQFLGIAA